MINEVISKLLPERLHAVVHKLNKIMKTESLAVQKTAATVQSAPQMRCVKLIVG